MKRIIIYIFICISYVIGSEENLDNRKVKEFNDNFVFVEGGEIISQESFFYKKSVNSFYISKYEVTRKEWIEVMGEQNYTIDKSDPNWEKLPIDKISWYDAIEYCNKRSIKEGLTPVYFINKDVQDPSNTNKYDTKKYLVTINPDANGYRLPTEVEWEYAACGGKYTKGTCFSGSDNPELIAIYNSIFEENKSPKPVGSKQPNELGIYDMNGNVAEWCFDWYIDNKGNILNCKIVKGGSFESNLYEIKICYREDYKSPNYSFKGVGVRVIKNKIN